jgi:hypothetical protein
MRETEPQDSDWHPFTPVFPRLLLTGERTPWLCAKPIMRRHGPRGWIYRYPTEQELNEITAIDAW